MGSTRTFKKQTREQDLNTTSTRGVLLKRVTSLYFPENSEHQSTLVAAQQLQINTATQKDHNYCQYSKKIPERSSLPDNTEELPFAKLDRL